MYRRNLRETYHNWICGKVMSSNKYSGLLMELDRYDYRYRLPMDGNRYEDGIALRYRFGKENRIDDPIIASEIDIRQCSILEMLAALALRVSESVFDDSETRLIFMAMLDNLGLSGFTDYSFDTDSVYQIRAILDDFTDGLMPLFHNDDKNWSDIDLWHQCHRYLVSKKGEL